MKLRNTFIIYFFFISTNLSGLELTIDPFIGGQFLGLSNFTYTYQSGKTKYYSKIRDYIYGTRLSYNIFNNRPFSIDGGLEYYQGKEINVRYSLEDKWDKSNFGSFISFGWRNYFLKGSYYFSPEKKLTEDMNAGIGDLNDKLKGKGFGVTFGSKLFSYFKINFDYRFLTYSSIDSQILPSSTNSKVEDQEFSFSISLPIIFNLNPISYVSSFFKSNKKIRTKQIGSIANDQAGGIAIDDNDNTYITGYTEGNLKNIKNAGEEDIFLMKYNKDGNELWAQLLGTSSTDIGNGLAIDYKNNVYIVGSTDGGVDGKAQPGNPDIFLVKYKSNGHWQWTQQIWRPSIEYGHDIDTDIRGDIYVLGTTNNALRVNRRKEKNILIAKFNPSGGKKWTKKLRAKAIGNSIVSDKRGNVFVLGTELGKYNKEKNIILFKLNSNGLVKWRQRYLNTNRISGKSITLGSDGNIYVLGTTKINSSKGSSSALLPSLKSNILIMKLTSSGKEVWTKTIGTLKEDIGKSISLDSKNNIYITGHTRGSFPNSENKGKTDAFLLKMDSFGKKVWIKQFGTPLEDYGNGLAIDSLDNISVTGFTFGDLDGNKNKGKSDIFFVKFNSSGEKL